MTRSQAEQAARTIEFLKERLPSSVGGEIDGVLASAQTESVAEKVSGAVKGVFR